MTARNRSAGDRPRARGGFDRARLEGDRAIALVAVTLVHGDHDAADGGARRDHDLPADHDIARHATRPGLAYFVVLAVHLGQERHRNGGSGGNRRRPGRCDRFAGFGLGASHRLGSLTHDDRAGHDPGLLRELDLLFRGSRGQRLAQRDRTTLLDDDGGVLFGRFPLTCEGRPRDQRRHCGGDHGTAVRAHGLSLLGRDIDNRTVCSCSIGHAERFRARTSSPVRDSLLAPRIRPPRRTDPSPYHDTGGFGP